MSRTPSLLGATLLVALTAAPLAHAAGEGNPLRGGVRNPSNDASQALTRETQVIGDSATYGTRQSNKSSNGGGAIYGCRSGAGGTASGNEPCVRANNLSNGFAFELVSNGPTAGFIGAVGGDGARPFTTNATGVATGLNADRLDSKNAADITADAAKSATTAATAASVALRPFAAVDANGGSPANRGLVASNGVARQGTGNYSVTFSGDLSKCALSATIIGTGGGEISVQPTVASDRQSTSVDVRTFELQVADGPPAVVRNTSADRAFHLLADC